MFGKKQKQKDSDGTLLRRSHGKTEIDAERFERAKDDYETEQYVRDARAKGRRMRRKGLIHP
jgi:hypothetical protein